MSSVVTGEADARRRRRRSTAAIKESLRDLNLQLSLLNHHIGTRVELKDADFDCLDLITRQGPLSPTALARRAGLHPATMTGVLDRLERGGWVARERDPADRRAVVVHALRDRSAELVRHFSGLNSLLDRVCAGYTEVELELLADFLRRATGAGREAADKLASG